MDAEPGYDTNNLQDLRQSLERLNAAALDSGLIVLGHSVKQAPAPKKRARASSGKAKSGVPANAGSTPDAPGEGKDEGEVPRQVPARAGRARGVATARRAPRASLNGSDSHESAELGKAGARRLLTKACRVDGDKSSIVIGTQFTEDGVIRLLVHLRKPRNRKSPFLRRFLRILNRPVALGIHTSAGISVEALQLVSRQLLEIEAHGWHYFQTRRAARRGEPVASPASDVQKAVVRRSKPTRSATATAAESE